MTCITCTRSFDDCYFVEGFEGGPPFRGVLYSKQCSSCRAVSPPRLQSSFSANADCRKTPVRFPSQERAAEPRRNLSC